MQKWEYMIVCIKQYLGDDGLIKAKKELDEWGKNGWELVSSNTVQEYNILCFIHHMKRPVEWKTIVPVMTS